MTTHIMVGHVLDKLAELPDESVHMCVTSPPYFGLRSYGTEPQIWPDGWRGELGLEPTPALYIEHMVAVFREVRRVLRKDTTCWANIGDSYAASGGHSGQGSTSRRIGRSNVNEQNRGSTNIPNGYKPKDLLGIPWMLAFALRDDGWWLRSEITWAKKAPMPESVTDRPTCATEKVFLLTKSARYFYDAEAVKEDSEYPDDNRKSRQNPDDYKSMMGENGQLRAVLNPANARTYPQRNMRNFWLLGPEPFSPAHFATFPTEIPRRAILAGTSERGVCPQCSAPWERLIKRSKGQGVRNAHGKALTTPRHDGNAWNENDGRGFSPVETETLGWRAACHCHSRDPIPATVLDPFLGSGTTALVADQLRRDCIGIDLKPQYAEMARDRVTDACPLFAEIGK